MGICKIHGFLFLLVVLCSCNMFHPKYVDTPDGRLQPAKSEYCFSKKTFVPNNLVDTSVVYMTENMVVTCNKNGEKISDEHCAFGFIEFSSTGTAFLSSLNFISKPEAGTFESLPDGQCCFYESVDSSVIIEYYRFDLRLFELWHGKIQPNGDIYFYSAKGRPFGTYSERISYMYKKSDIKRTKPLVFPE